MKRKIVLAIVVSLLSLVAYLCFWPVPIQPVSWQAPAAPGYVGAHAVNNTLAGLQIISLGTATGPEHVVLADDGKLYASVDGGNILRMNADGSAQEVFVNTGGRALGFDFDAAGNLIVADAHKGLLSINPAGEINVLADSVEGHAIRFADAVVVAANGKMYFSDASTRFAADGGVLGSELQDPSFRDIMEQSATGRLLEFNPDTGTVRLVARGFSFANGVALSSDETMLFVAETGRYRVWEIAVTADKLDIARADPLARVLMDNLPGFPDNLMRGVDGKIWLGFPASRDPALDALSDKPFLRKLVFRLPGFLLPPRQPYGHAIAFTEDGKVVADLQDPTGAFPRVTGITETADRLYVHTLNHNGLGWLPRRAGPSPLVVTPE